MITVKTIQNEINYIPVNRLEEVYQLIYSFHRPILKEKLYKSKILDFAGTFNDMSDSDYKDLVSYTKKSRAKLFNRNINIWGKKHWLIQIFYLNFSEAILL